MYFENLQYYFYQLDQYSLVLRHHFQSIKKKRKVDKTLINTTPTHFFTVDVMQSNESDMWRFVVNFKE